MTTSGEIILRSSAFFGVLAAMLLAETVRPFRPPDEARWRRGGRNLSLHLLNTLLLRVTVSGGAVFVAGWAAANGWGLLNRQGTASAAAVPATIVALDLAVYVQHRLMHRIPVLWRFHRLHHSDTSFDTTTGVRFHPAEILLSEGYKALIVMLLGAHPAGVAIFAVLLNGCSLFNHGNVRLPAAAEKAVSLFLITPDLHRIHHSVRPEETDSNFGFSVPWWDRLLGTFRSEPEGGQAALKIGLDSYPAPLTFGKLLKEPLHR